MSAPTSTIHPRDGQKLVVPIDSDPAIFAYLSKRLGVSPAVTYHDVYSLTDPDLLAFVPRPVHALIINCPGASYRAARGEENVPTPAYNDTGDTPVLWIKQNIHEACGTMAILHSVLNGPARKHITPGSLLARLREDMVPLEREPRAKVLEDSVELEVAHAAAAAMGQSEAPELGNMDTDGHFLAFVVGDDRHLWELCGYAPAPVDRGALGEGEDALSERAVKLGVGAFLEKAQESLKFSIIAVCLEE
ncbi:cysteine proteinase [Peniophora sp. CONT]|nr:cysteine proteinase [Peniophora sp. CONT]